MEVLKKVDKSFIEDERLRKIIQVLESFIEIDFDMMDVCYTIEALRSCSSEPCRPKATINKEPEESADFIKDLQPLLDEYNRNRNPVQIMRDNIWEYKDKIGVYGVLMFLENRLAMSLEQLLNGAVVKYSKAFNESQRRSVLSPKKIFKNNPECLEFHNYLIELRNKHYAHTELELGKHMLAYVESEDDEKIEFVTDSHTSQEFWPKFDYLRFYQTVEVVREYLKNEMKGKAQAIKNGLSKEQMQGLRDNLTNSSS